MRRVFTTALVAVFVVLGTTDSSWAGVDAVAHPAVVSVDVAPRALAVQGGSVTVFAHVAHAQWCLFEAQRAASAALTVVATRPCSAGRGSVRVVIAANRSYRSSTIHFRVTARGANGTARKTIAVIQAARTAPAPRPTPSPGAPPLTIQTTSLPQASTGVSYAATLSAVGGTAPYAWSVVAGSVPPGLQLAASGALSGTPSSQGQWNFTVQVSDAQGHTAGAPLAISVSAASVPAAESVPTYFSTNWSGYALLGGPFTGVTGTFNVPSIYATPTDADTAEWVGIDGTGSTNPGIIQAGVNEAYIAASNGYYVWAWVELFPAPAVRIPLPVTPGDSVTVTIATASPGLWDIVVKNNSNGQAYAATAPYTGPATSAEWIVEAPTLVATNEILTLANYTPVTFTQLGVNPLSGSLARLEMVQNGATVSVPSTLTANGFTVAYGSVTPAAP